MTREDLKRSGPPGPRLPGWTAANRLALLHELSFVAVRQTRSAEVAGDHRRDQSSSSAVPRSAAAIGTTNVRHTADSRFKAEPTGAHLHATPGVESIPGNGAQRIACENGSLSDRTGPHAHFH